MSRYFRMTSAMSLAASLTGCVSCMAQRPAVPSGWAEHKDPAGFLVDLPQGWSSETAKDRHLMFHSADSREFAYALSFQSPNGGTAREWIAPLVKHLNSLMPGAQIVQSEQVGDGQDAAVAKLAFSQNGNAAQANVLCEIANGRGVFYAIAAPAGLFAAKKPVLCKILGSVRPLESTNNSAAHGGAASSGPISYVNWTEPNEHAFIVQVPKGWKLSGGIFRYAPIDVRPQVEAGSPDGQIHLQFGDANFGTFATPGPSSILRGKTEGQSYEVNGVPYIVMRPVSGADFSKVYVERNIAKKHTDVKVTGTHEVRDDVEAAGTRSSGPRPQVSTGETEFTYTQNGKTMNGICHVKVTVWGQGTGQTWTASPNTITASPERIAIAKSVVEHMIKSTVESPEWDAQVQKTVADFNRLVIQNHEAAMQQLHDIYAKFTRNMAENQRQWSNIINNQADVVNKQTGETMKVDAGYDYYYAGGGGVVGSNSANGNGLTPLTKY